MSFMLGRNKASKIKSLMSIAMPAMGCGLGGLKWSEVQLLIVKYLGTLPDLDVYVYEPQNKANKMTQIIKYH